MYFYQPHSKDHQHSDTKWRYCSQTTTITNKASQRDFLPFVYVRTHPQNFLWDLKQDNKKKSLQYLKYFYTNSEQKFASEKITNFWGLFVCLQFSLSLSLSKKDNKFYGFLHNLLLENIVCLLFFFILSSYSSQLFTQ